MGAAPPYEDEAEVAVVGSADGGAGTEDGVARLVGSLEGAGGAYAEEDGRAGAEVEGFAD